MKNSEYFRQYMETHLIGLAEHSVMGRERWQAVCEYDAWLQEENILPESEKKKRKVDDGISRLELRTLIAEVLHTDYSELGNQITPAAFKQELERQMSEHVARFHEEFDIHKLYAKED